MKRIKRVNSGEFVCVTDTFGGKLNFNPLLQSLTLKSNFILLHWNKIFRAWGLYDVNDDSYVVAYAPDVVITIPGFLAEILDRKDVLPTAVVLYPNAKLTVNSDKIYTIESR